MILQQTPGGAPSAGLNEPFVWVLIAYAVLYLFGFFRPLLASSSAAGFHEDVERLKKSAGEDLEKQDVADPLEAQLAALDEEMAQAGKQLNAARMQADIARGEGKRDEESRLQEEEIEPLTARVRTLQEQLREVRRSVRRGTADRLEKLQSLQSSYSHTLVKEAVAQLRAQFPHGQYQRFELGLLPSFGAYSEKLSAARSMAGVFVLLGLLGTMIKLNGVVDEIRTLTATRQMESSDFLARMSTLMQGIGGAFSNSIYGVVLMVASLVAISFVNSRVQRRVGTLDAVVSQEIVPTLAEIHNRHLPELTLADILRTTGDQLDSLNTTVDELTSGMQAALLGLGGRIGEMLHQFGSYQKQYKQLNDWVGKLDEASTEMRKAATSLNQSASRVGQPIDEMNRVLQDHLKAQAQYQSSGVVERLLTDVKANLDAGRIGSEQALARAAAAAEKQTAAAGAQAQIVERELREVAAAFRATSGDRIGRAVEQFNATADRLTSRLDQSAGAFERASTNLAAYSSAPTFFYWLTQVAFPAVGRVLLGRRRASPSALVGASTSAVRAERATAGVNGPEPKPRSPAKTLTKTASPKRPVAADTRPARQEARGAWADDAVLPVPALDPAAPTAVSDQVDHTARVSSVFVDWCRTAGGNVSRMNLFAEKLKAEVRGAEVQTLCRDRNASTLTFVADGAGDPVEYWMVTVGRESMLFPRPLKPDRFRELAPVFVGEAAPPTIHSIVPASLQQQGGSWTLDIPGWVK